MLKALIALLLLALIPLMGASQPAPQNVTQFTLAPGYYEYLPVQFPGAENMSFGIVSNVTVNVYAMTQQQFITFNSTSYSNYVFSASGTAVNGTIRGSGIYYLVVNNNISSQTAGVSLWYSFQAVDIIYSPGVPVPTGIADYGVMNRSGVIVPYEILAKGITGFAEIYSLGAYNNTPPINVSPYGASLQLNIDLQINTTHGNYVYWLQNVADFETNNNTASFGDNIWNYTSYSANMSSISGSGTIGPNGNTIYYGTETQSLHYSLPLSFLLFIKVFNSTDNTVEAQFSYQLNGSAPITYDTVTINAAGLTGYALMVNGYNNNPGGVYYDAELVFGGESNGELTTFTSMNSTLNMWYTLVNGSIVEPRSVYPFGGDTEEAATNLHTEMANSIPTVTIGQINYSTTYSLSGLKPEMLVIDQPQSGGALLFVIVAIIIIAVLAAVLSRRRHHRTWRPKQGIVYKSYWIPNKFVRIGVTCDQLKPQNLDSCTFSLKRGTYEIHVDDKVYYISRNCVHVTKTFGEDLPWKEIYYTIEILDMSKLSTSYPPPL
ncbi:MAG: thermopsin [Nitrososphaerota archaeon]|jgi:thermopsin|nr:thermopsin [Nitrososphaerota archaeon]MDG7043456.1 thermopsin [Nitrososphaerota archaeon]